MVLTERQQALLEDLRELHGHLRNEARARGGRGAYGIHREADIHAGFASRFLSRNLR